MSEKYSKEAYDSNLAKQQVAEQEVDRLRDERRTAPQKRIVLERLETKFQEALSRYDEATERLRALHDAAWEEAHKAKEIIELRTEWDKLNVELGTALAQVHTAMDKIKRFTSDRISGAHLPEDLQKVVGEEINKKVGT